LADVNANIGINFDTSQALAQLRQLQSGLSRFNQTLTQGNISAMNAQKGLNAQLVQAINATGKFVATQKDVATSTSSFTSALEKNQLSMRQYFRYTAAAASQNTRVFKGMFAQERETLVRASKDRVKLLQSQYIQMQAANGDMIKVLQVIPKHLKMVNGQYADYATRMQMAAQRQQFLNQLLKQGSTQLLNFGKNTQWAGRQLMVGLTIPLSILGSTAAKTFMEMEQAVTKFSRVYGDITTGNDATNKAIADIQLLAKEFTKYGIGIKDTIEMAGKAAAMGLTGNALNAQVIQATRLAVLGQVEQQQALETTISLTNAFGIASEDLSKKINFLNAVENQTVLSIEDLTIAIPKAGPVIKQLGGSVEDLAFFMTAMKEGGINASEGANALKSGLASMINPSKKASEMLAGLGINIKGIVEANSGDLKGTVVGFARALDTLDPLNRARAIEQLFGKFQFARLSTLFQNVTKDSSQAARALGLAGASVEELAILSERELGKVEDMTGNKFKKSMENLKLQLVPVGKAFLQAVTPIVNFVGKILEKFNGLSDGTKKVITIMIGVIGGLAPIALMTFGILANGAANLIKFFAMLRGGIAKLNGSNNVLGGGFDYLTNQETENLAETNALHTSHNQLISTFNVESTSVNALAAAYGNAASQARALASSSPGLFNTVPGPAGAVAGLPPKKFATGGVVPGTGNSDTVPAMLTPGEVVLTKQTVKENPQLIAALQNGSIKRYGTGTGKSQTTSLSGKNPVPTFNVGGQQLGLAIKPESEKNITAITKIVAAMQITSDTLDQKTLGVENGAEVLEEVFARLAGKSKVGLTEFLAELRIATEEMKGVTLSSDSINQASGFTGKKKIAGHSADKAEGGGSGVRDDMYAAGKGQEYERLQGIANNTAKRLETERPELPKLQRPSKTSDNVQLDRGHISAVGATDKSISEGWDPALWELSTHAENEMAQTLVSNNDARRVYLEKLKQSSATEEEILSISQKVTSNGALNERELQVQSEVLRGMLSDKDFMAAEQKKAGKGNPMSIEKSMLATVYDAEGRASIPLPGSVDTRSTEERVADGRAKIEQRKGKYNENGGSGFVPLSDAEKKKRLESISSPTVEVTAEDETKAKAKGAKVGKAAVDGLRSPEGTDAQSPSKKGIKAGKEITDGLIAGMQEGQAGVSAQSSKLGSSAVPTAAQTQAKVDKMDLGNKAFYDDINTPDMRDQRQILKSQDRQRRKLGVTGAVGLPLETSAPSQTSSLIISSTKKTATAAEQLAIKTEEAVAAESQVVQQIKDESKSRVKIKGNTINIGKAGKQDKIVDGINNVADSTTLVADQTDELANITGDAVDAQTETAGNLLTGAQITDATTGNMNDVLQSTDMTGVAQDDLANSSDHIAKLNREIEEKKRIENELGKKRLAKLMAEKDGVIPQGAQSDGKYIDESKAYDITRAQDEAFGRDPGTNGPNDPGQTGYTRNKKGQILFDPETGQPTTLTQKQLTKKKRGMRKEKVGKYSGKAAGALGTATMVAGMVGAPPQVTAALGTAATVAQFAPAIAGLGPVGIAVAGIAAVGVGLFVLNKHLQASYAAQAKFVRETSASTKKMAEIGAITGKVGASEIMAKKRSNGTTRDYIVRDRAGSSFGDTFMQSETGKAMSKTLQANVQKSGAKEAAATFATEIAAYVQDGVLTAAQAQDIAYQIGINFKDTSLGIKIDANLSSIIGPNGEDLAKDPMVVGMRLVASSEQNAVKSLQSIDVAKSKGLSGAVESADLAARDAVAVQMAQMQADAVAKRYDDEIRALEAQIAQTKNKEAQVKLEEKLTALKQKSNDAEFQMNNLVANATDNAMKRFTENIQYQNTTMDALTLGLYKLWGAGNQREAAYMSGLSGSVTDKYANTEQATQAQTVQDRLAKYSDGGAFLGMGKDNYTEAGFKGGKEAQAFEVKMKILMANGTLTPNQETAMLDLFEGNLPQLEAVLDIGTRMHGASGTAEFIMLLTNFQDKEYAQKIALEVTTQDNDSFKKLSDLFGLASWLDGKEINMEVVVKEAGGVSGLQYYIDRLDELETKIKALKGKPITQDDVAQFSKDTNVKVDNGFLDYVNKEFKGDAKKQTDAIRTYTLVYKQIMSMDYASEEARAYFKSQAGQIAVDKLNALRKAGTAPADVDLYIKQQTELEIDALITKVKVDPAAVAGAKTEIALGTKPVIDSKTGGGATPGSGAKKEDPLAFLESLAMRIKMVRDQAFNAKKPIESMLAAFNSPAAKKNVANMFKLFDGLQQKLIALKVPQEFRDYIAGLDAQQLEDLKKADLDKKKAGQQGIFTYAAKKDKKGNVLKDKKGNTIYDTSKIVGISPEGQAIMAAYKEAPLDKFNIAQKAIITDTDNQFKAFNKLKAQGVETNVALETVSDAVLATAIASSQLEGTDLAQFVKDLKSAADAAEKAAVMADLLKKNADFKFKQDTFPKLASALKIAGLSAENIATVLQDPALAKQLMADLEDGKIDSKAIADYLNSIKDEKIVEIRAKFNAGDFAGAAAPGMELVNKMFAVQEQLIRTGVSGASKDMVKNVKALKDVNDKYQIEIQRINLERIKPLEKAIEKEQRRIEMDITRKIEVYQENVNSLQRVIEIAFERPIAAIQAENTIMSNDMEVMNHAAEEINKRYDEQATALEKVSQIKSQMVEQEKEQLDLADALSKGDIGAAARAVQAIRAAQAARNAENASKALELSRKNKIDSLTGKDSGLTKDQITERQYQNAQTIYDLENRATTDVNGKLMTRLQILDDIKNKSDEIYKLEQDRKDAQLGIRNIEDEIYNRKRDELAPLEDTIDKNNYLIARDEYAIEQLVKNTTVLGKTKDVWDGISAKIEASALAGEDFDRLMGTMLASTDKIEAGWKNIEKTLAKYSDITGKPLMGLGTQEMEKARTDLIAQSDLADSNAIKAKQALADAQLEYETKKKQYDLEVESLKAQLAAAKARNDFYVAGMIQQALVDKAKTGQPVAPITEASTAADNPNANYNDLTQNAATDLYKTAKVAGPTTSNAGGGSSSSSGSSGSSGGSSSTVPSPGTTTPPKASVTGTASTGTSTVSGVSEDKIFSTNSIEKITNKASTAATSATTAGLTAAAGKLFTDMRNIQVQIDKDYPNYFDATEHIQTAPTSSATEDQRRYEKMLSQVQDVKRKAALRAELDKIMKLKEEQRKYYYGKDSTGKTVAVSGSNGTVVSEKKKTAIFDASQALTSEAKELLDMLKNRNQVFKTDKAEFDKNKTAYSDKAKSLGFDINKIDWNALKKDDPASYKILLPLGQSYAKSKSTMEWRELAMNKARTLLENAGYTKEKMSWYFGTDANAMTRTNNSSDYSKWTGYSTGGLVASKFAQKKFNMGTDTVPAMLTPGEFVMNKFAVQSHGVGKMQAMNNGQAAGDSVYNYSISVNVKSESNPDEIARTVIAQIKSVDSQKMRGVRT
jgi:hypothetical protein